MYAGQLASMLGDLARASVFAERGWIVLKDALGKESSATIRASNLAMYPTGFTLYRLSQQWSSRMDEVPYHTNQKGFEDWLWMRFRPMPVRDPGQTASLGDRTLFPGLSGLPHLSDPVLSF
jgi:hypothetical protein